MTWIKTDDQMVDHPKYQAHPDAFKWAHRGLSYANRFLTDGHLPVAFTSTVPDDVMDALTTVVAGQQYPAWHRNADRSVEIHDFHDYQPTRKQVKKQQRATRRRQAKWRKTKAQSRGSRNGNGDALLTAPPSRPVRTKKDPPNPRSRGGHATRRELQKATETLKAFRAAEQEHRLASAGSARWRLGGSMSQQVEALAEIGLTLQDLYEPKTCMHTPACDDRDDCLLLIVGERRPHEAQLLERAGAGPKPVAKVKAG